MMIRTHATRVCAAVAVTFVGLTPSTSAAADREHQQIMADLRILQEQTQQLQALMTDLGEALKAVNSRIEDQTSLERKAFADGKVQMDTMSGDLRVVREKVDETNVRLGTITQELESLRMAIPEPGAMTQPPMTSDAAADPDAAAAGSTAPQSAAALPVNPGVQPQRLYDSSWSDYTAGNYSLAVQGFESYLRSFPRSARAHQAQLYVAESLAMEKKDSDAIAAYDRVIANYPESASVSTAYYKRGIVFERMGEPARARESYESVIKQFPDSTAATLAKQRLEAANRPTAR